MNRKGEKRMKQQKIIDDKTGFDTSCLYYDQEILECILGLDRCPCQYYDNITHYKNYKE
jgi:hypothetical protein